MGRLAAGQRFEEAGRFRERLTAFVRGASRSQRLRAMTRCPEIVAARKEDGRWVVHVVRFGRLAAAGVIPGGADAAGWVRELQATADTVVPGPGPLPASTAEEAELLLRWLESDGVRLVHVDGEWTCPVGGASRHLAVHDAVEESRRGLAAF
jgi:DNA polymerase-3 subunit epsilon